MKKKLPDTCWDGCDACGCCCRDIRGMEHIDPLVKDLISEDGSCTHYDKQTKLCAIYADKPWFCDVQEAGKRLYPTMTTREYLTRTTLACDALKRKFKNEP